MYGMSNSSILEHTRREMSDSSASATDYSPGMAAVADKKGENRARSELATAAAAEEDGLAFVAKGPAAAEAGTKTKKWRVPQDMIDFILAMDVSDYVFATPDNMDDMPISDEYKARYRADRKNAVVVMQECRATRRKMQEWVRAGLEKNGYVEVETTAEMLLKHQLEEYIDGQIA